MTQRAIMGLTQDEVRQVGEHRYEKKHARRMAVEGVSLMAAVGVSVALIGEYVTNTALLVAVFVVIGGLFLCGYYDVLKPARQAGVKLWEDVKKGGKGC